MPLPKEEVFTTDYIYSLPDGKRAELIDGQIYDMAPPTTRHQFITGELYATFRNYIRRKGGPCKAFVAPFAVFLYDDGLNYVEPDVSVICNPDKIDDKGCHGAPDLVIEVVSPSSQRMDYFLKLFQYRSSGVREYWIVNPMKKTVQVYLFGDAQDSAQYSFNDIIPVGIYDDLQICIADLLK